MRPQLFQTAYAVIQRRGRNTASGRFWRRLSSWFTQFLEQRSSADIASQQNIRCARSTTSKRKELTFAKMPRDQTNKHLYSMLHPFLHILCTCTKSPFPISPQKANLDMLTLDRHQSEQAPIIFINTHHTRIEPHTIRFTSYTPSVWNSSLLNFSIEHAHSQIGQSRFFFFATQSLRSNLHTTFILLPWSCRHKHPRRPRQPSLGSLGKTFVRTPLPINMDTRHPGRGFSNSLKTCRETFDVQQW